MAAWLAKVTRQKGYSVKALTRRYQVERLRELNVGQYREALKGLEALSDREPAPDPVAASA